MISGSKEHSYEVDWWACGIAICELLFGHSPFLRTANENAKEPEMCNRILNEEPNLSEIRLISGSNISKLEIFIKALLVKDPKQRLGKQGYSSASSSFSLNFDIKFLFFVCFWLLSFFSSPRCRPKRLWSC